MLTESFSKKLKMWKVSVKKQKINFREFSPKYFLTDQVERNFLGKEKIKKSDINQRENYNSRIW